MSLERDHLGRFVPGNGGGPGRPKKARHAAYLNIVEELITLEDWRTMIEKLKKSALQGERDALRFLAPYLLGRPALAAPYEDETEDANQDATALPPELLGPPAQMSPSTIKQLSQQLERQKRRADEAAETMMNKQLAEKQNRQPASPSARASQPAKK